MEIDYTLIGSQSEQYEIEVEKGAIRKFADAIGDSNPLYRDERFAIAIGYRGLVAPPTFPVSFRVPEEPVWTRNLDRRRILAGEVSFEYQRAICAGDKLICRIHFTGVDRRDGRSGKMEFLRQEIHGADESGNPVFIHRKTTVYREAKGK